MDKKTKKALEYEVCIQSECPHKQKLMKKLGDAFTHWGHEKKQFKAIQDQMKEYDNTKRFLDMPNLQDLQDFVRKSMSTLLQTVSSLIALKQQNFEKKIASIQDDNKKAKQLYLEVVKEIGDINFDNIRRCTDGWEQLFDPSKDSKKLQVCQEEIKNSINQLERDLIAVLNSQLTLKKPKPLETLNFQPVAFEMINNTKQEQTQKIITTDGGELFIFNKPIIDKNGESKIRLSFDQTIQKNKIQASIGFLKEDFAFSLINRNAKPKQILQITAPNSITSLAMSKDFIASGSSSGGLVQLWNRNDGKHVHNFIGHEGLYINLTKQMKDKNIWALKFSKDGTKLISGSNDTSVRIWDVLNKQPYWEASPNHTKGIHDIAINPQDTQIFVTSSLDGAVKIWNIEEKKQTGKFLNGHNGAVFGISYSDDGQLFASGGSSNDKCITIWNAKDQSKIKTFSSGHSTYVWRLQFSKNKLKLISTGDDDIKIWDIQNYSCTKTIQAHPKSNIDGFCYLFDDKIISSVGEDGMLKFWDITRQSNELIGEAFKPSESKKIYAICKSEDEKSIVIGSEDKQIRVLDTTDFLIQKNPISGGFLLQSNGSYNFYSLKKYLEFYTPSSSDAQDSKLVIRPDSQIEINYSNTKKELGFHVSNNGEKKNFIHKIDQIEQEESYQFAIQSEVGIKITQ